MAGLRRYLIARTLQMIVTLLIILTIVFILFELLPARPDDLLGQSPLIKPSQKEYLRHLYGFDRPVTERYFVYMRNMLTFDFGYSISRGVPVNDLLSERIPRTLYLFGMSVIISYVLGALIGSYIAWKRGGIADGTAVLTSLVFYNMPSFWLGLILLFVFSAKLGWFPLTAWPQKYPFTILDILRHTFLPLFTLLLLSLAGTILLMRTSMLEVIGENYILTAIAKGLPERKVLFRHATRNALLPLVTSFVIALAFAIGGAVVLEQVFSFPGVGFLYITSLYQLDFPVAQATIYIITLLVLIGNYIADMLYAVLDPRIRLAGEGG
ncbi:MAG TPA: ABC transporter permease [Euryarchaeota archaeon]|nr:MAG: ABC transporter permease [Thermoplasmata archaeon]HDD59975.1 ABC transporter permease [Euryarchaeota archaeon]